MELGEPDESGRRKPVSTGKFETMDLDTVIVALGTGPNPIIQRSAEAVQVFRQFTLAVMLRRLVSQTQSTQWVQVKKLQKQLMNCSSKI